jgi:hypothetical protein
MQTSEIQEWYKLDEEKYKAQIKKYNELFSKTEEEWKLTLMGIIAENDKKEAEKV